MSDHVHSESTWGPYESAHRDHRGAQPYRLQKANKSEGQRSRWASDIRQSQPDHWSSPSKCCRSVIAARRIYVSFISVSTNPWTRGPRDPRAHSERRVSIQTPSQDDQQESLTERQLLARSLSQGPSQTPQREQPPLELRFRYDGTTDRARGTYY